MRWLTGKPSSETDPADAFEDGAAPQLQDNAASIAQRAITADDVDLLELAMQHTTDAEVRSVIAASGDADLVAKADRMLTVTPDIGGARDRNKVAQALRRVADSISPHIGGKRQPTGGLGSQGGHALIGKKLRKLKPAPTLRNHGRGGHDFKMTHRR